MAPIFLFGTLCHQPLLDLVAGMSVRMEPAHLPGYRAAWVKDASWPMLEVCADQHAQGALIDPDPDALARLDFYEACFGYARAGVTVIRDGAEVAAEAWFPSTQAGVPGADWSLPDWARRYGAAQLHAATEVMRQMGQQAPEEVGRRFPIIRARAESVVRAGQWQRPGHVGAGMTRADVVDHGTHHIHDGFFNTLDVRVSHRRFDGGLQGPLDRSAYRVVDAVTVLPYDPVRDRILLIEQFRVGPYANGDAAPWLLEAIAGILDAGETAEATARREAQEEANLTLDELHFVARYYPTPGGVAQVLFSYLATADLPDEVAGQGGHVSEGEDILSHLVTYDLACQMLHDGDMATAPLILSMQYLMLHRDRLRAAAGLG
ncbi:NUDIX domain-containing protein [Jannaschia sp. CCS1]|uniref:NUDIX domain-containing protein n=1 Tax=Jannaschia sp. (strain CCS1) TaxID=290400 RepID=UPI000053A113|nr:NUDIX domain-containing protein [Jannaschia sp. CCS1]ABD54909.1 Nucleoside diphosphate pyrophosphatase [Jannaschia sp. CCS1]